MLIMVFSWLSLGYEVARLVVVSSVSVLVGAYLFRKYVSPEIVAAIEQLDKADETITNLAKLAGVKSQQFTDGRQLEKTVAADFIANQIPELEAAKLVLSPDTWGQIEEAIERNPAAVIQLWEKWKPYFTSEESGSSEKFDF